MSAKNTNKYSSRKKSSSMTTEQSLADYFVSGLMLVYVFFMLVLYPLLYHNKYFDMGDSKYAIFKWSGIVGLGLMTLLWIFWLWAFRDRINPAAEVKGFSLTDWLVAGYFAITLLSFLLSSDKGMALWGYKGWNMGFMSQLFFVLSYFYVSRFWKRSNVTIAAMVVTATICYQIGVLQRFGFNPLGMYDGVGPEDIEKFLSTLGQTSWYSSYAVLIVPFGMYYYWTTDKRWLRILSGLFVALGFGMICTTNSDSAYVAIVLIMMVFFRYSLDGNEKMKRFLEMAVIGLFSCRVIGWMQKLFPERQRTYITGEEKISKFVTSSGWMLLLMILVMILYALFWVLCSKKKDGKEGFDISKYRKIIWGITVTAAVLVIWGVMMLVILVTTRKLPASMASLYDISFLNFDVTWGNHRGFNWRAAVAAFSHANFKDLLVGVGPDCFATAMDRYYKQEVADYWNGLQLACAHNEWLNMLVTEGILGLASYVAIFVCAMRGAAAYVKEEPVLAALIAGTIAYMGHNIFCYQQCICTPVVFIFMGIMEGILRERKRNTA
ncbi:MAG: O-antigen ligase family protein [Lachnospiraceae bacterium]|nr:O-antigen ligase family protein [Lachnospiraceae bacterium]